MGEGGLRYGNKRLPGRRLGRPRKRKKLWIRKKSWNLVDQREELRIH